MLKKSHKNSILQKIGLFFHDHKEVTIVFWLAITGFGVLSYTTLMQRQGFPNVDVPVSIVSGTYFVNDKNKVDTQIVKPMSTVIASLSQVKSVSTQAGDFYYTIVVEYQGGISSEKGNNLVKAAVEAKNILPKDATQEFKAVNAGRFEEQSDMLVSITQQADTTIESLQKSAQFISLQLAGVDGVKQSVVLEQIKQGTDPETGENKQQTTRFDRLGVRDGSGAIVFYPSVMIGVRANANTDALKLYDNVTAKIQQLQMTDAASSIKLTVAADFAESIRSQISSLQQSLFEGLLVVILVSCLLISLRAGIVTALSMVTVLLGTIGILYAAGITLNTITLFGLILSLGLIVDDTTIMVEAIDAEKNSKLSKREIVATAVKRVARASFAGTLTTMLAFAPMLFIGGILGSFIRILPVTIIVSLFVSLVVSLTLVPFLARFLLSKKRKRSFSNPILKAESFTSRKLADAVVAGRASRSKRYMFGISAVLFSAALFFASIPLIGKLKFDIFPNTKDSDTISVTLRFDDNTTLTAAAAVTDEANLIIGDTLGKNLTRLSYQTTGTASSATATIDLVSFKQREQKSPEFIKLLQSAFKDFNGAEVKVSQIDAGPPKDDYPFTIKIKDEDTQKARKLARYMAADLLGKQVTRLNGTTATIVRTDTSSQDVVRRDGGAAYVSIRAGFDADDVSALVSAAERLVNDTYTPERLEQFSITKQQLTFDFGNESDNQDSFKSMLIAFPVLLLCMYILLVLQFKSFLQPLLIFTAIPFSFFGVAAGLYVTKNPLSFFVMVGFFALIGIAVNNTILLTDYANQARDEGKDKYEAMSLAIRARFRPLITTSLTSVVALIPLALTDPFWESLSVTLIFGLLSSTLLVVVAFPYYYLIGEWLRTQASRAWNRELPNKWQYVADILIAPIRVVRFLLWVVFAWRS